MNRKKEKITDIYVITFKINQRDLKTKHGQINKQGGGDNGESKTKEHRKTTDDVAGPHVTDMQEGKKKKKNKKSACTPLYHKGLFVHTMHMDKTQYNK